jgi:osmotically-inducible protein OsmY
MKKLSFFVALTALPVLSGCIAAAVGTAATGGYFAATDNRPVGVIATDARIVSEIKFKILGDNRVSVLHVDVGSYEGVVTLTGSVPNEEARRVVIDIARSIRGVRRIEDVMNIGRNRASGNEERVTPRSRPVDDQTINAAPIAPVSSENGEFIPGGQPETYIGR